MLKPAPHARFFKYVPNCFIRWKLVCIHIYSPIESVLQHLRYRSRIDTYDSILKKPTIRRMGQPFVKNDIDGLRDKFLRRMWRSAFNKAGNKCIQAEDTDACIFLDTYGVSQVRFAGANILTCEETDDETGDGLKCS